MPEVKGVVAAAFDVEVWMVVTRWVTESSLDKEVPWMTSENSEKSVCFDVVEWTADETEKATKQCCPWCPFRVVWVTNVVGIAWREEWRGE